METSEIEVFLALAEELHFTRTAERLHLSQSRVSRLISALERRVGGSLFERTSRQVALTPLGARLRDRVGPAWSEVGAAFAEARDAARNTAGRLRIGCPFPASSPVLNLLAETFTSRFPECEVALLDVPVTDIYGPLRRGEIDVLAYWLAGEEPDLTTGPVLEYRDRVLVVGREHRLAGRESVSAEDLADEEVQAGAPGLPAAVFDALVPPFAPSGRPIPRVHPWLGLENVLALIASGRMVHPAAANTPFFQRDDVVSVPIRDLPPLPLGLIWRAVCENARIRALAAVARRIGPSGAEGRPDTRPRPAARVAAARKAGAEP